MRYFFYIFIFYIVLANKNFAQEVVVETSVELAILNDYELSAKQSAIWNSIKNNWLVSDYQVIESENMIELNCTNCESFYVEVIIKINADGKLEYYKLLKSEKCGMVLDKKLELRIMRNFFKFEYLSELRNVMFKTRLGNVLKC